MTLPGFGKTAVRHLAMAMLTVTVLSPMGVAAQHRNLPPRAHAVQDDDRPQPNETRPLPDIVARVQSTPPYSGMDYIGVAGFETRTMVYVLRFLDGRQVVVVRVDARSGRILGRGPR